jgi:translation initiation factor 1
LHVAQSGRRYERVMSEKKGSPFAGLAALRDKLPEGPRAAESVKDEPAPAPASNAFAEKVVVSRSKKGRGGKVVTTIAGVRREKLEPFAQELRKALGCGATVEEELIVVQGDQAPRVKTWLETKGARRVIVGS